MKLQLVLKIDSESFDEYKLLKTATLLNSIHPDALDENELVRFSFSE